MWGFSFDDLAKRAQEEAAKLAEQAQAAATMQSPFNLDSMNPEVAQQQQVPSTVASSKFESPFPYANNNNINNTAPPVYNRSIEGNNDHVTALVTNVPSPRISSPVVATFSVGKTNEGSAEKKTVTKLPTGTDDFFDSWGDGMEDSKPDATETVDEDVATDVVETVKEEVKDELQKEDPQADDNEQIMDGSVDKITAVEGESSAPFKAAEEEEETEQNINESVQEVEPDNAWEDDFDIPDANNDAVENPPPVEEPTVITEEAGTNETQLAGGENKFVEPTVDPWGDNDTHENDLYNHKAAKEEPVSTPGEIFAPQTGVDKTDNTLLENEGMDNAAEEGDAWADDLNMADSDEVHVEEMKEPTILLEADVPVNDNPLEQAEIEQSTAEEADSLAVSDVDIADVGEAAGAEEEVASDEAVQPETEAQGEVDVAQVDVEADTNNIDKSPKEEVLESVADDVLRNGVDAQDEAVETRAEDGLEAATETIEYIQNNTTPEASNEDQTINYEPEAPEAVIEMTEVSENDATPEASNEDQTINYEPEAPVTKEVADEVALPVESQVTECISQDNSEIPTIEENEIAEENVADAIDQTDTNLLSDDFVPETDTPSHVYTDPVETVAALPETVQSFDAEPHEAESHTHQTETENRPEALPVTSNAAPKSTLFDGAPDIAAATQSFQSVFGSHASNLFDTSKSSSMFQWSFHAPNDVTPQATEAHPSIDENGPSLSGDNNANVVETKTPHEAKEIPAQPIVSEELVDPNVMMDDLYNDDALDDMYDDDDDEEEEEAEEEEQVTQATNINPDTPSEVEDNTNNGESRASPEQVPQHVVDKFVKQLERMTESHQLEMDELNRTHRLELDQLRRALEEERTEKKKAKDREAVAAQDKHLSQMRELEKTFTKSLQEKETELEQVMKRNEGISLKMDSMKREVDGLLKLVDERDDEICRLKQGHGNTMLQVEGSIKVSQEELSKKEAEIREFKSSMSSLKAELDSTTENYNTLKSRAKAVATELKDRRVEVRTLNTHNEELTTANASLETELANLKDQNNQQQRTIGYKDKDIEVLNEKIKALNKDIEAKDSLLHDRSSVGEKAISSYKRKAQEALAAANSRLAAANQAREEAESDAKAAKIASDDAVERARISEAKRIDAERAKAEASSLLEKERNANSQVVSELQQTVDDMKETIESIQTELADAESTKASLVSEMDKTKTLLNEQKETNLDLRQKLIEAKDLCNSLQEEVHDLRDEAQRTSAAAFKRQKDESLNTENKAEETKTIMNGRAESDGTIIMLQQELQGANDAISELKLALRMALLDKTESASANAKHATSGSIEQDYSQNESDGNDSTGNSATPLFFAIEKQNELNMARDEINRLANMLGDAESEKQEAFDAMNVMRQKMEEANARLQRYEKLGMKTNRPPSAASTGYSSYRGAGHSSLYGDGHNGAISRENDSAVNLEYLKNVMLSYLNAKSLAERRKLVPVVATVLCLTPEEHAKAVQSVEDSAGLTGVASSLWENLESKAQSLM